MDERTAHRVTPAWPATPRAVARLVAGVSAGIAALLATACVAPAGPGTGGSTTTTAAPTTTTTVVHVPPPRPLRVSVFGDSVGWTFAYGSGVTNATAAGDMKKLSGSSRFGCRVGRYAKVEPFYGNPDGHANPKCDWSTHYDDGTTVLSSYAEVVAGATPNLPVVWFCGWDTHPSRIPFGNGTWDPTYRVVGDPAYDAYLRSELSVMADHLLSAGAKGIVLLTCGTPLDAATLAPRDTAAGVWAWNDLLRSVPAHDSRFHLLDAGAWLDAQPDPLTYRGDGEHFGNGGARLFSDRWLDARILALAAQLW